MMSVIIQDWDNPRELKAKRQMENLTAEEGKLYSSLETDKEKTALLMMRDTSIDWGIRLSYGRQLSTEALRVSMAGYKYLPEKSIPAIILRERGL